jgi:hypothetical protein
MSPSGVTMNWEYLIVGLPELHSAALHKGESASVVALNREGELGWEAVAVTPLAGGGFAVLLKRPLNS